MTASQKGLRGWGQLIFRVLVFLSAFFFLLWITLVGVVAVLARPYLMAAYWFLGLAALLASAAACFCCCPIPGKKSRAARSPVRAAVGLGVVVTIGFVFWTNAKPAMAESQPGMEILGALFSVGVLMASAAILLLIVLLLLGPGPDGEGNPDPPRG